MTSPYLYPPFDETADGSPAPLPIWARVLYVAATVVFGFFYGSLGSVQHQATIDIGGNALPVGLFVSLAGYLAILALLRSMTDGIGRTLQFVAGALASIAIYSTESVAGTILIPANEAGWAWLIGVVLASGLLLLWPRRRSSGAGEGVN